MNNDKGKVISISDMLTNERYKDIMQLYVDNKWSYENQVFLAAQMLVAEENKKTMIRIGWLNAALTVLLVISGALQLIY